MHLFSVSWHRVNPWTVKSAALACFILPGVASEIRPDQASFLTAELREKAPEGKKIEKKNEDYKWNFIYQILSSRNTATVEIESLWKLISPHRMQMRTTAEGR